MIPQKPPRLRAPGLLDVCALQILRYAQDDNTPGCHPERSEGSGRLLGNHQDTGVDNTGFVIYTLSSILDIGIESEIAFLQTDTQLTRLGAIAVEAHGARCSYLAQIDYPLL